MDKKNSGKYAEPIPEEVLKIAKAIAADAYVKVEFDPPLDPMIRFLGRESIYARSSATNNVTLPAKFLSHRLVKKRYFFALPPELWERLYQTLGAEAFDKDLIELENAAAEIWRDCPFNVGFHSGKAFQYSLLQPLPSESPLDPFAQIQMIAGGYAGWLMANPQFLVEHDKIISKWTSMVRHWGFKPLNVFSPQEELQPENDPTKNSKWPAYSQEFKEFFIRWRLLGLAAPYLPIPLEPMMGGVASLSCFPQFIRTGGVFCYPDTLPVPNRDEFRSLFGGALYSSNKPDHLEEWMKLITKDKPVHFDRLFKFQHYYRILHHRHRNAFRGKTKAIQQVLTKFLGTSEKTLERDLGLLRKRLGKDWLDREPSWNIGPF